MILKIIFCRKVARKGARFNQPDPDLSAFLFGGKK